MDTPIWTLKLGIVLDDLSRKDKTKRARIDLTSRVRAPECSSLSLSSI